MKLQHLPGVAICMALLLPACSREQTASAVAAPAEPVVVTTAALSGERLAYVVGCVHCHHQLPKQIMNPPSLLLAQTYSRPEFTTLLRTGVTRDGRDLYATGSPMGFTAREQLSYLTDEEVGAIHDFLRQTWTAERVAVEEAKIPPMPGPPAGPGA